MENTKNIAKDKVYFKMEGLISLKLKTNCNVSLLLTFFSSDKAFSFKFFSCLTLLLLSLGHPSQ